MTPATKLISKITPPDRNRRKVRQSTHVCFQNLVDQLQDISNRHLRKKHAEAHLAQCCFQKPRFLKSKVEEKVFCKIHLEVAINEFKRLFDKLKGGDNKVSHKSAKEFSSQIQDYLFDLKPFVEYLEHQDDPSFIFIDGGKFYSPHTFELFRMSKQIALQLAYRSSGIHLDHRVSQITSVFILRQALEVRFQRIIAVNLHNHKGDTPRVRNDFYYEFISTNSKYFEFVFCDFSSLKYIYTWTNVVVHKAYQPYIWQVDFGHRVCSKLFQGGPLNSKGGDSINGSVRINDQQKMQSEFIQYFFQNYDHEFWSVSFASPEAITDFYS